MKQHNIRIRLCILALGMTLCLCAVSSAENLPADSFSHGIVTELTGDGFRLKDSENGDVFFSMDAETVLEGVLAETPLHTGMFVMVRHNGRFTRSLPPRGYAQRLGCYPLTGTVKELYEDSLLLTGDPIFGDVLVQLSTATPMYTGIPITIYYDGAMTLSLPARVSARHIVIPMTEGTILGAREDSFLLDTNEGAFLTVRLPADCLLPEDWELGSLPGRRVSIYHNGDMPDGSLTALKIVFLNAVSGDPADTPLPPEDSTPLPSETPADILLPPADQVPAEDPSLPPAGVPLQPAESLTPAPAEDLSEQPTETPVP